MQIRYSENAKQWPEGFRLIQNASQVLADVVSHPTESFQAEWSTGIGSDGGPVYTLRITDAEDAATNQFTVDDLQTPWYLRIRLSQTWQQILKERSHRAILNLQASEV